MLEALKEDAALFHLLFMDIELGDTDGIILGNTLREHLGNEITQIVFISYRKDYALQLFRIRPLDFLIKPMDYGKIRLIMDTYRKLFPEKNYSMNTGKTGRYTRLPKMKLSV